MAKFTANPDELRCLSNEIRNLYNDARYESDEILLCVMELPNGWEGEASVSYINQFRALNILIRNAIDEFEEIVSTLNSIADSLDEGEKNAWHE